MKNLENTQQVNISIAPVLKKMDVGDVEKFPIKKYSIVGSTKERVQTEKGYRFTIKKNNELQLVEVTRIA